METSPKSVQSNRTESTVSASQNYATRSRNGRKFMVGRLPDDFLRIKPSPEQAAQIAAEHRVALNIQQQLDQGQQIIAQVPANFIGRLDLTIIEARLVKNYGVTRMDPYAKLRVGHQVYETQTAVNGARNPVWNKVFHCFLPKGVDTLNIEIFDEKAFTEDERIAWVLVEIPQDVFEGSTREMWVDLNGKQGKEGTVGLVMTFTPIANTTPLINSGIIIPAIPQPINLNERANIVPPIRSANIGPPVYIDRSRSPPAPPPVISEADINQLRDMFPSIELQVIRTILESERGDKNRAINGLLAMSN